MRTFLIVFVFAVIPLAACTTEQAATSTPSAALPDRPTRTPPPTATLAVTPTEAVQAQEGRQGDALPIAQTDLFSTSGACAICHTNLIDEAGQDVSIDTSWRSTLKANASRDPYWQASVRSDVAKFPELTEGIEDTCATCHMPMAQFMAAAQGETGRIFGGSGFLQPDHEYHSFAMDGISCSLCHQIRGNNFGGADSFTGGFLIDTELRAPDRLIFGPYTLDAFQTGIMQGASGFRPEQGLHISESEMCATCHTLYSPYLDANGQVAGEFPEQVTYYEWFYSDFRRTKKCVDCHMPGAEGGVKISSTSDTLRSPFSKHDIVGGNAYMLKMLDEFGDELGVAASTDDFQTTIDLTIAQLQGSTAELTMEEIRQSGNWINADVTVKNLTGHKFPTGFPSRRAWIRFVVKDSGGNVLFESGGYRPDGSITGNDNDDSRSQSEQHYAAIVQPDQVQIYEAILLDTEGDVTTTLLKAASYRKDNRLLPSGYDKRSIYEDLAVRGEARDDEDFQGGIDSIHYTVDVSAGEGPYEVTAELLYQSIGFRWAENLRGEEAEEIARFVRYYDAIPNEPVVIASLVEKVGE
jgi:hypothetical protein